MGIVKNYEFQAEILTRRELRDFGNQEFQAFGELVEERWISPHLENNGTRSLRKVFKCPARFLEDLVCVTRIKITPRNYITSGSPVEARDTNKIARQNIFMYKFINLKETC